MQKITLTDSLARYVTFFAPDDPAVPAAPGWDVTPVPDLSEIRRPLPSRRRDYTCAAKTAKALWLGAPNGLTRYAPDEPREADRVMYFSANRELADNNVLAVYAPDANKEAVWVRTENGVSHIELKVIGAQEKAEILTNESLNFVDRHGMVTQKELKIARDPASAVPYGHSDNSGTFTCMFAVGELCKYAVYKRTLGEGHAKTQAAKKSAIRACEACLLLCYISRRGNGFVARTYITKDEPVPDDGLFYRITGGKATCLPLTQAKERGIAGRVIDASAPIPARLRHMYEDEGYTIDDITYKGDTSSDEITHHYLLFYFIHEILGEEDPELDALVKDRAKAILDHILTHNNALTECDGEPTTWAKWNKEYFSTPLGWSDGCLNAAELLSYLKITMHVTGEQGRWAQAYKRLAVNEGYAYLTTLHDARFFMSAASQGLEQVEELMYGDNSLATCAYWMLITLEKDEALLGLYKAGYKGWNGTFRREHDPAYDFPYMLCFPEEELNTQMLTDWFRRQLITRVCSTASIDARKDAPCRIRRGGMKETGCLLPPDEHNVTKYDRNPLSYLKEHGERGLYWLESCYVYTYAYWLGRYYGIITEETEKTGDGSLSSAVRTGNRPLSSGETKRLSEYIAVFRGEIAPRTVQKRRLEGYLCCVFIAPEEKPGLRLLEDVDGTKILSFFCDGQKEFTADEASSLFDCGLTDLPVQKIEGKPDDSALTRPKDGVLRGPAPMFVNAENIALGAFNADEKVYMELYETAGRETAFEVYCEAYDFGFKALFPPWEMKRFLIDISTGRVNEQCFEK